MGRSHPRLSVLSNRRAIRRLACRKRFDILFLTRNPPCFVDWVCSTHPLYPRKQGRFRVFLCNQHERFACLRTSASCTSLVRSWRRFESLKTHHKRDTRSSLGNIRQTGNRVAQSKYCNEMPHGHMERQFLVSCASRSQWWMETAITFILRAPSHINITHCQRGVMWGMYCITWH